jgi:hypothetical protein
MWWRARQQAVAADQAAAAPAEVPPTAVETPPAAVPESAPPAAPPAAAAAPPAGAVPPPSTQTPASPAASAPPQPRRVPATAKPKPAEPPAPAAAAPQAPPVRPPTEPAAAEAPPSPKPPAPVVTQPDVSFRKVKLVSQAGESENAVDVVLMFLEDRLTVTPTSGGTALRSVRYRDISGLTYAREEKKRLGLIKTAQHLLTVDARPAALLLRLDKDNVDAVLSAFESRTGKSVSR